MIQTLKTVHEAALSLRSSPVLGDCGLGGLFYLAARLTGQMTALPVTDRWALIFAASVTAISMSTGLMPTHHTEADGTN